MEFRILGPLEVLRDGRRVALGGPRQRAVLARLLLDPGRPVSASTIVDDVWDGRPPATALKTLQKYVSELRKALTDPEILCTRGGGYAVEAVDLDATHYQRLIESARRARDDGAASTAAALLGEAEALWRGPVLADLADARFADAERVRLDELHLAGLELDFEVELELGHHARAAAELAEAVELHPLREHLWALFLRALHAAGRQAEALRAYERYRRLLADELGLEPSPDLRRLEGAILRHELAPVPDVAAVVDGLPSQVTSFVGRRELLDALERDLDAHRLLTLTGSGGVGKTRVALELARGRRDRHPGGVVFVDLVPAVDSSTVARAVSEALGLEDREGDDRVDTIVAVLRHRPATLLVLDNCEHVVAGCAAVTDTIVRRCPAALLLATSRTRLGVNGECVRVVPPLAHEEAVALFAERAALATADFALTAGNQTSVEQVCRQLDGLPLAIELAASQTRVLAPAEIAARLDDRFALLSRPGDPSPRQRTLRATVAWSFGLLSAKAQRVFVRLGVFAGSFTLEAAEAVCAGRGIAEREVLGFVTELVDQSMLVRETGPPSVARYRLLDTLRLYAHQELVWSGDLDDAHRGHASFVHRLARAAAPHFYGPGEMLWRSRLQAEDHNIRAAMDWAVEHDPVLALRLAMALWGYWDIRWFEREAIAWLDLLLARRDDRVPPRLRAWAATVLANLAGNLGEARQATVWAENAVAAFAAVGVDDQLGSAWAQLALAAALGNAGAFDRAMAMADGSLASARALGDELLEAKALEALGQMATRTGELARSNHFHRRALDAWQRIDSARGRATVLRRLAAAARDGGRLDEAETLCLEALGVFDQLDDPASLAHLRLTLADVARLRGQRERATELYDQALGELRNVGDRRCISTTFKNLASMAIETGDHERAAGLLADSVHLRHELGDELGLAECFDGLAEVALVAGDASTGTTLLAAARARREASRATPTAVESDRIDGLIVRAHAQLDPERFESAWQRGVGLSPDDAVGYALGQVVSPSR